MNCIITSLKNIYGIVFKSFSFALFKSFLKENIKEIQK